ncbi:imidazole glycerol phosphate synthase subunit HisH [Methylobacillus glycogenes]|uniref:imidazole glycerol phosphate synthase subunit HisH n=1 Tax=Methylobacillus glycogenes TaxID=406 RepID=UPI00046F4FE2|nr:imidazole glycerol phosphate synthase subunit HisH [Methylobacillus glycogenes]
MKKICILDYGLGNVRSVSNAIKYVGAHPVISNTPEALKDSHALIVPGVGAFAQGMSALGKDGLQASLLEYIKSGKHVLGICLGMQLLFDRGEEFGVTTGLGLVPGVVSRIVPVEQSRVRLPHISWAKVDLNSVHENNGGMFDGLPDEQRKFYFLHSYAAQNVPDRYITGSATYSGCTFVASVQKDNIWGMQFHPEKSGPSGLQVLNNFVQNS